jgi:hypothetical protein
LRGGDDFRAALEAGDFRQLRRISETAEPHLARLTDEQAEIVMHDARTRTKSLPFQKRAWSHRWLTERGLESGLPDRLRPKADQLYPRVAAAVGISVTARNPLLAAVAPLIRESMQDAVLEAQADGRLEDDGFVRARMQEARERTTKALLGRIG